MSTYTYKADLRGKLVTVEDGDSVRVYSAPEKSALTAEFIDGPVSVGTTTGKRYTDGVFTWIEIVRSMGLLFNIPQITVIYLIENDVTVQTNPAYNASTDTSAPNADGSYKGTASVTPVDTGDVTEMPGPDRVPVTASNGKTVYVLAPAPTTTGNTPTPTQPDNTQKYITWGIYGVLGLSIITVIIILIQSANAKKAQNAKPKAR